MNKIQAMILGGAVLSAIAISGCLQGKGNDSAGTEREISQDSMLKRGEYIVSTAGCDDCHSPKVFGPNGPAIDPSRRLSGYRSDQALGKIDSNAIKNGWALFNSDLTAAVGPWGVSFAANLTPDSTGIGGWTEAQFIKALREGKSKGLDNYRPILPPMPWQNFRKLTDTDLRSIFAYLKSIPPVKNVVPQPRALKDL